MLTIAQLWNADIERNLIADTYFALSALVLFSTVNLLYNRLGRRRLMHFLGVGSQQSTIAAHVSYTYLSRSGAPARADIDASRSGSAAALPFITQAESEALASLRKLVEGTVRDGPDGFFAAVRRRSSTRRINITLRTDPAAAPGNVEAGGLTIMIGTGRFNPHSAAVLDSSESFFRFAYDDRSGLHTMRTFYVNDGRTGHLHDYIRENGRHPDLRFSRELAIGLRQDDAQQGPPRSHRLAAARSGPPQGEPGRADAQRGPQHGRDVRGTDRLGGPTGCGPPGVPQAVHH